MIARRRTSRAPARRTLGVEFTARDADTTPLFDALARLARRHRLPRAAVQAMHLGLDEIVTNALGHGRFGRRPIRVHVDLAVTRGAVEAIVTDSGRAFNPLTVPEPDVDRPLLDRPIGGLGILLVKRLMDSVTYARVGGSNRVTLRKLIARPAGPRPNRGRRTSR